MHWSHIDVVLDYQVAAPAHLVFNLEAARGRSQTVVSESLAIDPPVDLQAFCDEASGNRFVRFAGVTGTVFEQFLGIHMQNQSWRMYVCHV